MPQVREIGLPSGALPARAEMARTAMNSLLLADNEPIALKRLEIAVHGMPDMAVIAKATTGSEAARLIRQTKPDIVMLDIDMGDITAVDIVRGLRAGDHVPEFIFVSGSESFAAWAFDINAVDYLVKPAPFDRVRQSLRRARERLWNKASEARIAELQEQLFEMEAAQHEGARRLYHDEIWVRAGRELARIAVADVDMFEAAGDYVLAHVGTTTHLLKESLTSLEERLDPRQLIRVHRGSIINVKRVRSLRRLNRRSMAVILVNGVQVTIGPTYSEKVLKLLDAKRWR